MPTNCYECDAALHGPICSVCNPQNQEARIAELEASLLQMTEKFCDFAHNSGMMIEDPETHAEVLRARERLKNT